MNLNDAQKLFVEELKSKSRSSATITAYGQDINQLIAYLATLGKSTWPEVETGDIQGYLGSLAKQNYTPKSVSRKINSIKTFYKFLVGKQIVSKNSANDISHPKFENKVPRILTQTEYRALRDSCRVDARISAIVEVLLQTGIRIGELAALTLESFKNNSLTVPPIEAHAQRTVPLNRAALVALENYLSQRPKVKTDALFITKTGRPFLIRNMRTAIDRYFKMAGIKDAKVNYLRHTFIAHHFAAGASPVALSQLVGHRRIATTEKYLEYVKNIQGEKIKLDEL